MLSFEQAVTAISARYRPGSIVSGSARNALVEAWGQLVGRQRALAEFDFFVSDAGSLSAAARRLQASTETIRRWRAAFETLPEDNRPRSSLQGKIVGGWHLVRRLGGGGNGEVWLGRKGQERAAIKVLSRPKGISLKRFCDEIAAQKRLSGIPGILPIIDSFVDSDPKSDRPWLATPVAQPLREVIGTNTTLEEVVRCTATIAFALARAHELGFAHRDIKPENIFYRNDTWELGDFGLVDFPGKEDLTQDVAKLGPIYFIAPEMLNDPGRADGQLADSFSLAKTFWVLATGQHFPAPGQLDRTVPALRISSYAKDRNAPLLEVLLEKATAFTPADRPTSAEIQRELQAWLHRGAARNVPADSDVSKLAAEIAVLNEPHYLRKSITERENQFVNAQHVRLRDLIKGSIEAIGGRFATANLIDHRTHVSFGSWTVRGHVLATGWSGEAELQLNGNVDVQPNGSVKIASWYAVQINRSGKTRLIELWRHETPFFLAGGAEEELLLHEMCTAMDAAFFGSLKRLVEISKEQADTAETRNNVE
jgi:serine/threonine protein kinase